MAGIRTTAYGADKHRSVKVASGNVDLVSAWVEKNGGSADHIFDHAKNKDGSMKFKDRVRVKVKGKGWRMAQINDLVVKREAGDFYVVKAD